MSSRILASRGVHVASSHFSNINATNENNGCLYDFRKENINIFKKKIFLNVHNNFRAYYISLNDTDN